MGQFCNNALDREENSDTFSISENHIKVLDNYNNYGAVVSFELEDDKLVIIEECDEHFTSELSKDQAQFLIDQLQLLVNKLK